ncbi:MAG: helix-turn-helix transcriptional regulator [Clostridia bacterium]|nr:helix-turn-helix transcriptional regulator [Clostridia bacterium]
MNLGEHIYKHRTKNNLSQTRLAEELGVSRQSISKWENNSAVPELDKLIKMSEIFEVTLDELVFDRTPEEPAEALPPANSTPLIRLPSMRIIIGLILLMFGMIFFLLSIFWGDHLYFGEEFGELASLVILLISVALLATYNLKVLTLCAIAYTVYSFIWYRFIEIVSLTNYLFTCIMSVVIVVWFIKLGLHYNKKETEGVEHGN